MDERDDLTDDERAIERTDGVDGEEAHRIGEFDDLRDRLQRIEDMLGEVVATLGDMRATAAAIDIDNGASVADVDGDGDADIIDDDVVVIPDYDEMDLDL